MELLVPALLVSAFFVFKIYKTKRVDLGGGAADSRLKRISGKILALGSSELHKGSTIYNTIRLETSGGDAIIDRASVGNHVDSYLTIGSEVTLYYLSDEAATSIQNPRNQVVFGIRSGSNRANDIDSLVAAVALMKSSGLTMLISGIILSSILVGIPFVILSIKLRRAAALLPSRDELIAFLDVDEVSDAISFRHLPSKVNA